MATPLWQLESPVCSFKFDFEWDSRHQNNWSPSNRTAGMVWAWTPNVCACSVPSVTPAMVLITLQSVGPTVPFLGLAAAIALRILTLVPVRGFLIPGELSH